MIGPIGSHQDIYVTECGRQFASHSLGRSHERDCCECKQIDNAAAEDLKWACEAVVATAFGNPDDLTESQQLEAMRMAAEYLKGAMASIGWQALRDMGNRDA